MAVTGCVAAVPSANRVAPMPPVMLIWEPHIEKTEKDRLEDMRTVVEHDDAGLEVKSMLDAAGHVGSKVRAKSDVTADTRRRGDNSPFRL